MLRQGYAYASFSLNMRMVLGFSFRKRCFEDACIVACIDETILNLSLFEKERICFSGCKVFPVPVAVDRF